MTANAARSGSPDEETPLLNSQKQSERRRKETPVPWAQFSLVLFLQLAEPLTSQVIFPFTPQLVRELGITHGDDKQVGYYVGLLSSLFFGTQAITVMHWSRISDRIGRKPVILVGLFGLSLSMYSFGLSKSFTALVISRCLNGALNGNIGVIKSVIGELTDSTNIARALSYQPIAWSSGATLGPLIGGALAHPAERFPNVFGANTFLKTYPYFLPCAIPATFSLFAWIITFTFLKETNHTGFTFSSVFRRLLPRRFSSDQKSEDESDSIEQSSAAVPMRSLLTPQVILSTATYALLSLIDISFRALLPVFYAEPRSLGGLGLPPSAIGTAMALLGLVNGIFQIALFHRLIHSWGIRGCYLMAIGSAIPIFALFPIMSAVVRHEDTGDASTILGAPSQEYQISTTLVMLAGLQLLLTVILNLGYGSVFIYITAAAGIIPTPEQESEFERSRVASSSSSITHIPSSSSSQSSVSMKHDDNPPKLKLSVAKRSPRVKGGKKTLGTVNGIAQMIVSIMRCLGPLSASSIYAKGLAWEYGKDAGEIAPVAEPLDGTHAGIWNRLGGLFVYMIMITICVITLVVGSRLPVVPWKPLDEEIENEAEVEAVQEL